MVNGKKGVSEVEISTNSRVPSLIYHHFNIIVWRGLVNVYIKKSVSTEWKGLLAGTQLDHVDKLLKR